MLEKCFTKMDVRYKILCQFLWKEKSENTWKHFSSFKSYFYLDGIKVEPWIGNPVLSDINCLENVDLAKDGHIDLRTENLLQLELNSKGLEEFWYSMREANPRIVNRAMEV
jgi:hypothetical protein